MRALRGVRQASELGLTLDPDTTEAIRRDGRRLVDVSAERIRDEYVHILDLPDSAGALGRVERLGLLRWTIPELDELGDVVQERTAPSRCLGALVVGSDASGSAAYG